MTDKQIIIKRIRDCDNCKFRPETSKVCSDYENCYMVSEYIVNLREQLKAKEQECEFSNLRIIQLQETLNQYETDLSTKDCLLETCKAQYKELKAENEELKEQLERADEDIKMKCTRCAMTNQLDEQLDQLKAEVKSKTEYIQEQRDIINQYSKEIEMYKKCQGKRASKREEELKAENDTLRQAIEKVREIANRPYLLPCGGDCKQQNCTDKTTENGKHCMELKLIQILQICDEVNDER